MKKFFAILMAMMMVLAMGTVAMADAADEIVHASALPATSEQAVSITITGLTDGSTEGGEEAKLPSEYHVRVKWDVQNGVYNATATDNAEGTNGFTNYSWDCDKLDFIVNSYEIPEGGSDIREGNWAVKPKIAFEVTNASTPDLAINAAASLKGTDAWASLLNATSIADQNTAIGTQTIAPVLIANLGTGVNSYELGVTTGDAHNDYDYEYTLNWNYDALNAAALASYKAGTGTQVLTNTFVVTITAE